MEDFGKIEHLGFDNWSINIQGIKVKSEQKVLKRFYL